MRTSISMPRIALYLATATTLVLAVVLSKPLAGESQKRGTEIRVNADKGQPIPFLEFVSMIEAVTDTQFILGEKKPLDPDLSIKLHGELRTQKSQLLAFFKTVLWANNWACVRRVDKPKSYELVRRSDRRAEKLQKTVDWVSPVRIAEYKNKADIFILTSIEVHSVSGGKRLITLSGYGSDLHKAVELIKKGIAARDAEKAAGKKK